MLADRRTDQGGNCKAVDHVTTIQCVASTDQPFSWSSRDLVRVGPRVRAGRGVSDPGLDLVRRKSAAAPQFAAGSEMPSAARAPHLSFSAVSGSMACRASACDVKEAVGWPMGPGGRLLRSIVPPVTSEDETNGRLNAGLEGASSGLSREPPRVC